MKINIKKLNDNAIIPTRGSSSAAGYDLYTNLLPNGRIIIPPCKIVKIRTGIAMEIPEGYFGAIYARSGLASKKGLRPVNCVGVIDSDYRGEIIVALRNDSLEEQEIQANERIGQIVIQPYLDIEFNEVDELGDTDRGAGGFGSTGA